MEWNNKRKADAENQKRNEDAYFAECAWENERRRREKEDALVDLSKKFGTLQEELDYITGKLTKVWEKYQNVQSEIQEG